MSIFFNCTKICTVVGICFFSLLPQDFFNGNCHVGNVQFALELHLLQQQGGDYWTGGNDIETEGQFRWTWSGKKISFAKWALFQPNNNQGREDCIALVGMN